MITGEGREPLGVCDMCSSLACSPCGARIPGVAKFRCALCWPAVLLLPAGVGPGPEEEQGGGGSGRPVLPTDGPGGGGGAPAQRTIKRTEDFEELVPALARESGIARANWRHVIDDVISELLTIAKGQGGADQLIERHAGSTEEPDVAMLSSVDAGMLLASQVREAKRTGHLKPELMADALGVASWAINTEVGFQPKPDRLAMLADARMMFVVGFLSPAIA